jgi:hypothetical protein
MSSTVRLFLPENSKSSSHLEAAEGGLDGLAVVDSNSLREFRHLKECSRLGLCERQERRIDSSVGWARSTHDVNHLEIHGRSKSASRGHSGQLV